LEQYAYRQQQNGIYSSDSHTDEDEDDEDEEEEEEEVEEEGDEEDDFKSDTTKNNESELSKTLTVKGSIITVADDLLKNDGKKFLDMMERLAERKMRKEREVIDNDLFEQENQEAADEDDEDEDTEEDDDEEEEEDEEEEDQDNEDVNYQEVKWLYLLTFLSKGFSNRRTKNGRWPKNVSSLCS
jgi:hypothetical protein